jgi:hypothetical protein
MPTGPNSAPKSESEVSDLTLIENIQNNVNRDAALNELIQRHSGIYFSIVNKFFPEARQSSAKLNIDRDLVFDSKDYVIYNSALTFDKDKGAKFSTHVGNQARYFCLSQINKAKAMVPFEPSEFENIFADETAIHDKIDESISSKVIEIIKDMPDERVYEIFRLRYLESKGDRVTPWSQIYKKIPHAKTKKKHLTIQGCINLHNKALKEIRKKIKDIKEL